MKKILFLILIIHYSSQVFSQEDTTKYQKFPNSYGPQYTDIWATRTLRLPDTTHKPQNGAPGAVARDPASQALYIWDGTKWMAAGGGGGGGGGAKTYNTMQDMIAEPAPAGMATVLGFYSPNDGGGGDFIWQPSSTRSKIAGIIEQSTKATTGRWTRILGSALNLRWFGAKGLGVASITEDTTALRTAVAFMRTMNNALSLYVPEAVNPAGQHSFYAFVGSAIYVGDNFKCFGDGRNKSEIRNVNPLGGSDPYRGSIFRFGTYGPDSSSNTFQANVPKYQIYPAAKNDSALRLKNIADAAGMYVGEVILYGCLPTVKNSVGSKPRFTYSECNQIRAIHNDTIYFQYPILIDIVPDSTGGDMFIHNINNAGISKNLGIPNGTCKNVDIGYMMLTQAQTNEINNTKINANLGTIWQPGNGFNCNFHDLTVQSYFGLGGNMWTLTRWSRITLYAEGKLWEGGYSTSRIDLNDIDFVFMESPASNFSNALLLMNDDVHDATFQNINCVGDNARLTDLIAISGTQDCLIDNFNVNFTNYFFDQNIIKIGDQQGSRPTKNLTIRKSSFTVGGAGNFIWAGASYDYLKNNIRLEDLIFHGKLMGYEGNRSYDFLFTATATGRRNDIYTTNGSTFVQRDNRAVPVNSTDSAHWYTANFVKTAGINDPLPTGVLTKVFGQGDATLPYAQVQVAPTSLPQSLDLEDYSDVRLSNIRFDTGKIFMRSDTACTLYNVVNFDSLLYMNFNSANNIGVTVPSANTVPPGNLLSIIGGAGYINQQQLLTGGSSNTFPAHVAIGAGASVLTNNILNIAETFTNITNSSGASAIIMQPLYNFTSDNSNVVRGFQAITEANLTGANLTNSTGVLGGIATAKISGTGGTVTGAAGLVGAVNNTGTGTVNNAFGGRFDDNTNSGGGVITTNVGTGIADHSIGTNNTNLWLSNAALSVGAAPVGNWSIYNASVKPNFFGGDLQFGTTAGSKIGTATNQKIAFYGSTPIVKPSGEILAALGNLGLITTPVIKAQSLNATFSAGQYLQTDVSGNLSFQTVSGGGATGYTAQVTGNQDGAPASNGTFCLGTQNNLTTVAGARYYVTQTGTVTKIIFTLSEGTAGSGEQGSVYIRVNNTTDYAISNAVIFSNGTTTNTYVVTGLNIPVNGISGTSAGDYFCIKIQYPTWVTAPTNVRASANVWIQTP